MIARSNAIVGMDHSTIAPIPHCDETRVMGQVLGLLGRMFDDDGW